MIDGIQVYDPKAPDASETSALLTVDPSGNEFFAMKNVPHGAVAERYYCQSLSDSCAVSMYGLLQVTRSLPILFRCFISSMAAVIPMYHGRA